MGDARAHALTRVHVALALDSHHTALRELVARHRHEALRGRLGHLNLIWRTIALHARRKIDLKGIALPQAFSYISSCTQLLYRLPYR